MAAVISLSLWWIWLSVSVLRSVASESKREESESGQNVTLTCRAPNNNNIIIVEWSRADLGEEYVLLYRNGHFDPDNQHPSFKNRVDLQDRQMKDGDVSLILKDVMINDTGTYECRVFQRRTRRRKRANLNTDLIRSIYLHVDPPGQTGGHTEDGGKEDGGKVDGGKVDGSFGLKAGLAVVVFLVVGGALVGCWLFRKDKPQSEDSHRPPAELQIQMSESLLMNTETEMTLKRITLVDTPQGSLMSL